MGETARGLHALQWTEALSVRVRQVNGDVIHNNMTELIEPAVNGRLQILSVGGTFAFRLLDEDDVETERGAFSEWMLVRAELVIP